MGLGCMGFTHAYCTAMDETEAAKEITEAVDMGYTFFDTAECYLGNRTDGKFLPNAILLNIHAPFKTKSSQDPHRRTIHYKMQID